MLWNNNWDILEHFLAQCAVQFPHSFDFVARVIAWRIRLGQSVDVPMSDGDRSVGSQAARCTRPGLRDLLGDMAAEGTFGKTSEICLTLFWKIAAVSYSPSRTLPEEQIGFRPDAF